LAADFFEDFAGVCFTADLVGVFFDDFAICFVLVFLAADTFEALFLAADLTGVAATTGVDGTLLSATTGFEALLTGVAGLLLADFWADCLLADFLVADCINYQFTCLAGDFEAEFCLLAIG
jgi:hypothetical protein